jgi:endonuclease G
MMLHCRRCLLLLISLLQIGVVMAQIDLDRRLELLEKEQQELVRRQEQTVQRMDSVKLAIIRRDLQKLGLPKLEEGEKVVVHPGHTLVYDEKHEQAKWTAHIATPDLITGNLARIDSFLPDPLVGTGTAVTADYWNSGYDRGHLVPSADMRWNIDALKATYLYSNVSPQLPELNRGTWAELEDWVRRYVNFSKRRVFVVTGPVLKVDLPTLQKPDRKNEVSIPERFFKVIADIDGDSAKALGFLMMNGVNEYPPVSYAVNVDSIETITGIDFFHALPQEIEDKIEAQRDVNAWYASGDPFFGEVEPLKAPLPRGMFNTVQAKYHVGKAATICGTVVSTRRTTKANAIYLNFDRMHPHQDFYATIWDYNGPNFSYDPEIYLLNKKVCVTGKITMYDEIPRISINNENEVVLYEEAIQGR